jgi:hypothetical protein
MIVICKGEWLDHPPLVLSGEDGPVRYALCERCRCAMRAEASPQGISADYLAYLQGKLRDPRD